MTDAPCCVDCGTTEAGLINGALGEKYLCWKCIALRAREDAWRTLEAHVARITPSELQAINMMKGLREFVRSRGYGVTLPALYAGPWRSHAMNLLCRAMDRDLPDEHVEWRTKVEQLLAQPRRASCPQELADELLASEAHLNETTEQIYRLPKPPPEENDGPQERVEHALRLIPFCRCVSTNQPSGEHCVACGKVIR